MADITTKAGLAWMQTPAAQIVTGMADAIAAIEAEAVRAERARLAAAVRGLDVPTWAGQQFVYRLDVLALLEEE